jgi:hypothetical protein
LPIIFFAGLAIDPLALTKDLAVATGAFNLDAPGKFGVAFVAIVSVLIINFTKIQNII